MVTYIVVARSQRTRAEELIKKALVERGILERFRATSSNDWHVMWSHSSDITLVMRAALIVANIPMEVCQGDKRLLELGITFNR